MNTNTLNTSSPSWLGGLSLRRGPSLRRSLVLAAGLALVLGATGRSAIATLTDDPPAQEDKGFDKPLGKKQAAQNNPGGHASSGTTMSMMSDDGTNRYELHVKDGDASAKMNGEAVPADRLVKTDAGYEIRDENGKAVYTFRVGKLGVLNMPFGGGIGGAGGAAVAPEPPATPRAPRAPRATAPRFRMVAPEGVNVARAGNPPVMIGIQMSDPEARLLKHIGAEDGIVIDSVTPNSPAAKGGLQDEDVVIGINDTKPINQEGLRDLIHGKKPGDQLVMHIVREGKPQDITVTLEAWDANVMGGEGATSATLGPLSVFGVQSDELQKILSEVEEQLQALKDNPDLQPEALKARADDVSKIIQEALQRALASLKSAHEKIGKGAQWTWPGVAGDGGNGITFIRPNNGDDEQAQARLEQMQAEMERAMELRQEALDREMEARQKALEKMQEAMEKQFEKMQEQFERQREQAEREKSTR
ncbi:MAG: PDZ domain-containing protein [Planctomycetota bacterium]|nr:PDZ domain-containing protein [Planctomycetota bacterium]